MALRLIRGDSQYLSRTTDLLDHNSSYTIAGWFRHESLAVAHGYIQIGVTAGDWDNSDTVHINSSEAIRCYAAVGGSFTQGTGSQVLSDGVWYHIALVRSSATDLTVYVNGVSEVAVSIDVTGRSATAIWHIGSFEGGSYASTRLFGLKAWQRDLTAAELTSEMRQAMPIGRRNLHGVWPFLVNNRANDYSGNGRTWTENGTPTNAEPPDVAFGAPEPLISVAAGSVSYTLSAASGTFTLTGTDVDLDADRRVVGGSGAFSLTGIDADLDADRRVVGGTGSLALTGQDVDLDADRRVTADSGSFTLTGTNVSLVHGRTIPGGSGTFTLTGTVVDLDADRRVVGGNGEFVLTGTDATLTHTTAGYTITAESGTFTLTGTDVDLISFGAVAAVITIGNWSVPFDVLEGSEIRFRIEGPAATNILVRVVAQFRERLFP